MTLTAEQRRRIRELAATVPLGTPAAVRAWAHQCFQAYGPTLPPPYQSWIGTRRQRAQRWHREVLAAAEIFASNRGQMARGADHQRLVRERRRILRTLATICDHLLADAGARRVLYLAPERGARTPLVGAHQAGMLAEKTLSEGGALDTFATFGPGTVRRDELAALAKVYLFDAVRPGPWVRDAARDLGEAARVALTHAPFRRDKIDDTRDQLIRSIAEAWQFATATKATVNNRYNETGNRGRFFDFMASLFQLVGDTVKTDDGLAHRIRRALARSSRGLFA